MGNKKKQAANDAVRKAMLSRSSRHHITSRVVRRARLNYQNWLPAAIHQLMQVLVIPAWNARALISEHCVEKTRM